MAHPDVLLLSRNGCHLCEDARELVDRVGSAVGLPWRERDVDDDPELRADWGDLVPVLLIDGVCHGYYTFDEAALTSALTGGSSNR